jgi:DNA-binding transcriptional ArsR family regulator
VIVNAFDVLGDPIRRSILDDLAEGERTAGEITDSIREEFGVTQPAVSHHLRVLRESGFTTVRRDGTRRLYSVRSDAFHEADEWLERFRRNWTGPLEALSTEVARGKKERNQR